MSQTLVIYDSLGMVVLQRTGDIQPPVGEVKSIIFDIPECQVFIGMNTETGTPIFGAKSKTEIELLREQLALTNEMATVAVEAIASMSEGDAIL
jgi:hypothetical protein